MRWTLSNAISVFRMLLVIPLYFLFENPYSNQLLIMGVGVIAYGSDLLDGYIARIRNEQSDLGRVLDPLADKFFMIAGVILMLVHGFVPVWFVAAVVSRDVIIFFAGMYLQKKTGIVVESNLLGKGAVLSVILALVVSLFRQDFGPSVPDMMYVLSLALLVISLYMYGERYFKLMKRHATTP